MLNTLQVMASVLVGRLDIKSEKGATAVEYGIMVAGIAVLIIAAVLAVGGQLNTLFADVKTALTGVAPTP